MNYTFSGRSSNSVKSPENKMNTTISSPVENTPQKSVQKSGDISTKKVKKVGPAAPSLDEDALKALTKGLVGKKKKPKKVRSEKKKKHKKTGKKKKKKKKKKK